MPSPRRVSALIDALMSEVNAPCAGKGGWPNRVRRQQDLMREAAHALSAWGRPGVERAFRKAQAGDLFTPPRQAAE